MEETKIDFVEADAEKKKKGKFKAKCYHCKQKEEMKMDDGRKIKLPFAYIELKKDATMMKEFKNYVKESEEKYKNPSVIKRGIFKGCPNCGHTIIVCCKDYVDFYSTKKKEEKVEK